jgi:peptidoglycan/xylan/chitin deacetylase (PgdA/CDA1 family)
MASVLERAGVFRTVMQLRRLAPVPVVSIVTYHHIHDIAEYDTTYPYDPEVADATPRQFRHQIETLARLGTPIGMDDLVRALDGAPLPPNPMMVTFDDGYRSCHDVALPILRQLGVPATFFIATSFVADRKLYWWERIALALRNARRLRATIAYPRRITIDARDRSARRTLDDVVKNTRSLDVERFLAELFRALEVEWSPAIEAAHADKLIMTWDQVRALARAGMAIESHTRHHRVLETLDADALRDELAGSRADLERAIGRAPRALAFPVGRRISDLSIRRAVAEAGYRIAVSNSGGVNSIWPAALRAVLPFDPLAMDRIAMERSMSDAMFKTLLAIPQLGYRPRVSGNAP